MNDIKAEKDVRGLIDLCKTFDLTTYEDLYEMNLDFLMESAYQAIDQDEFSIEKDEDKYQEEIDRLYLEIEHEELYIPWYNDTTSAIEAEYEKVGLLLDPIIPEGEDQNYKAVKFKVLPETTWEDAAEALRELIMGVGYCHVGYDVEEFIEISSCDNARDVVLEHTHWIHWHTKVYGG